jgi:predicted PurR-regulated permease PerM
MHAIKFIMMIHIQNIPFLGFLLGVIFFLLFYWLSGILAPFWIGLGIAYLSNDIVSVLARWKIPRWLTSIFIIFMLYAFFFLFIFFIIPIIHKIFSHVQEVIPKVSEWLAQSWIKIGEYLVNYVSQEESFVVLTKIKTHFSDISVVMGQNIIYQLDDFLRIAHLLSWYSLGPFFGIYWMIYLPQFQKDVKTFVPHDWRSPLNNFGNDFHEKLKCYLRRQSLVSFIMTIYYGLSLGYMGLSLAPLIAFMTFIFSWIPFFGFILSFILAFISVVLQWGWGTEIETFLWIYGVGYVIEGLIAPFLVGKKLGINPIWLLMSLVLTAQCLGMLWMIFAIPLAIFIKTSLIWGLKTWECSEIYQKHDTE